MVSCINLDAEIAMTGLSLSHVLLQTCCLTAGSSFLKHCGQGVQSISGLQLVAANLSGTLPV